MSSSEKHLYEFGEFRLDTAERLLLRGSEPVPLPPKVFDTLVLLVQNGGHLLEKDQLMRELWPDAFVEDVNLSVNISALRKVLGETENGEGYIDTVPKRGYRFTAQVSELESGNEELVVHNRVRRRIISEERESSVPVFGEEGKWKQIRELEVAATSESDKHLADGLRQHKTAALSGLALIVVIVAGVLFGLYRSISERSVRKDSPFQTMKIDRLTNSGRAVDATVSPDGKYVVYVMVDLGQQSLWLRQVAVASNVQIVPPDDVRYRGMTFSSDGNFIYYVSEQQGAAELYQMPVLGGAPRKLIFDIDSPVTLSPDGKRLAFLRGYPSEGQSALMVANADGTSEQKLAIRRNPDFFSGANNAPAWSPDGQVIACSAGTTGAEGSYMMVLQVRIQDGVATPMTSQRWRWVGRMAWFPDGKELIFTAQEQESSPSQTWYLSYPGGELHRITNDLNDYHSVSLTADGASLVTTQSDLLSSIWIAPSGDTEHAKKIRSSNDDGGEGISWTPDGRIVYASRATGHSDIWIMHQDGSNQKQLTADGSNNKWPAASADGRYIVFTSDRAGLQNIWRMDVDGNNLRQLTQGRGEGLPDCSPDGQWVVYRSVLGKKTLFKVSIDGGEPVPVNNNASSRPAISPDGKWIACAYFGDPERIKTAIYPFTGGEPAKILDLSPLSFYMRWTPDSRALAYIDRQSHFNIVSQPVDGGSSTQLTNFSSDHIFGFAWSGDGKQLALVRGNVTSDVVLISNFR
jgi:Tol biopolymer transport system component/DNA-binding winged helix-turn-helix (wHTH) protein